MTRPFPLSIAFLVLLAAPQGVRAAQQDGLPIQVALDRAGFSPGVIDGNMGRLTHQALRGFQEAKGLTATGDLDAQTEAALGQTDAIATVAVTQADAAGPFVAKIPEAMEDKAK